MNERVSSVLRKRWQREKERQKRKSTEEAEEGRRAFWDMCERMPNGQFLFLYFSTSGCQNTSYTHTHTHTQYTVSYPEHVCVSV